MSAGSLPEMNRRLLDQRTALVDTAAALQHRVRRELRGLAPRRQLQRHPQVAIAAAALAGLWAGRILGRTLHRLTR